MRLPLLAACAALTLSGCVSVFPKSDPVQLYQLGGSVRPSAQTAGVRAEVLLTGLTLPQAAAGDRLLATTGPEAAYIGAARWVTPASVLVREAMERGFQGTSVRLIDRRYAGGQALLLQVDLSTFSVDYAAGPQAAPTVRIEGLARIVRARDKAVVGEHRLSSSVLALDNRVGAIVQAYDAALGASVSDLVGWTASVSQTTGSAR